MEKNTQLEQFVQDRLSVLVKEITNAVRRNLADEVQKVLSAPASNTRRECIATDCHNSAKGPRWKYLCDDHKKAPLSAIDKWQVAARQARDAA